MTTLTRDEIAKLTLPEQLALIGDMCDSITDAELPMPTAQRRENEHRLSSCGHDKAQATT